jgi:group I intron endonuclease
MPTPNNTFLNPELKGKSGVYQIRCTETDKEYIGSAFCLLRRWKAHLYMFRTETHHCEHLQRTWQKYGAENFTFKVLEFCARADLIETEQKWMDTVPTEKKFNVAEKATMGLGFVGEATRKKMSDAKKGKPGPMLGKRHSAETKQLIGDLQRGRPGRPVSEESKAKISVANSGRIPSVDTREKMAVAKRGGRASVETRSKMSIAKKGRKFSPEVRANMASGWIKRKAKADREALEEAVALEQMSLPRHLWRLKLPEE